MKNRIEELRKINGYTIEALADEIGASRGMVSMLIKGERRLNSDWIEKFAKAFDCSQKEIIADEDEADRYDTLIKNLQDIAKALNSDDSSIQLSIQLLKEKLEEKKA